MKYFIYGILALIFLVYATRPIRRERRKRLFKRYFPKFEELVLQGNYAEALEMLQQVPVRKALYRFRGEERQRVSELEMLALEKEGRNEEALIKLTSVLSNWYEVEKWPDDLLEKWFSLYEQCTPIEVEKFYFCEVCGLHPEAVALFNHAIERGCEPPIGFPGKGGSKVIIDKPRGKKPRMYAHKKDKHGSGADPTL